jgi:hypothetical protein
MTAGAGRRLRVAALAAFLGAGAIGCQTATDPDPTYGPLSPPPWTIGGVRPGMTSNDVERLLGSATSSRTNYSVTTTTWQEISVTFDKEGRAIDVFGDRVTAADGSTVVSRGVSEAEVVGRLGPGKLRSSYQPSGSGVISCGSRRTGGERRYEDATTVYTVSIYEDRLASVRARPR